MSERPSITRAKLIAVTLGLDYSLEEDRGSNVLRTGSASSLMSILLYIPYGFIEYTEWREGSDGGLRRVWVSENDLAILTYCEGDVLIHTFDNHSDFNDAIRVAHLFYLKIAA